MDIEVSVDEEVASMGVFVSWTIVRSVKVSKTQGDALEVLKEEVGEIKGKHTLESLRRDPVVRAYRDFYWRIGIDPTKTRPSSEALVRRILRDKPFPLINSVVDAGNLVSAKTLVPIGLYDLSKVRGDPTLRMAREGEIFKPIGGGEERLTGKEVVLADDEKVMFLYPHRDSRETMITEGTEDVLIVAAGVPGVDRGLVRRAAKMAADFIIRFSGGGTQGRVREAP